MALSLLSQPANILDLHAYLDSLPLHPRLTKVDYPSCDIWQPMEPHKSDYPHQSNSIEGSPVNHCPGLSETISEGIIQNLSTAGRQFSNGFQQNAGLDYSQVMSFMDSPPNSEQSWTDEQSKGSPVGHIVELQGVYSGNSSTSRKRRMDWEALGIGHSENTGTDQSAEGPTKINHHEKDKHKKEKLSARGSWEDDIGFDLNPDFSTNSYLNNENFLSFSPGLTALKPELQSGQIKANKAPSSPLPSDSVAKIVKSPGIGNTAYDAQSEPRRDINENQICGCGSPQGNHPGFEAGSGMDKGRKSDVANSNSEEYSADRVYLRKLDVVVPKKLEGPPDIEHLQLVDRKFQYILAAATSIATKNNEETLTYLNQGQSYEIKLKKAGDLATYRDKILKSVIKICFHERRLQFMEREQMQQWQTSRPGTKLIEIDVPLSYGLCHVSQPLHPTLLNTVEVLWDPMKDVGVYIKVNCISTEFTPKKHGGEKGVPFRLQIETYVENGNPNPTEVTPTSSLLPTTPPTTAETFAPNHSLSIGARQPIHAAACQIKVFKLKGADRKHKQDREKIQKRPQSEQEKFQPSYDYTILNEVPVDVIPSTSGCYSPEYLKIWTNSPVHTPKYDAVLPYGNVSPAANSSPIAINNVTSSNSPTLKVMDTNTVSSPQIPKEMEDFAINIMPESTPAQVTQWLTIHRLTAYLNTFAHFSGADIMRMSKDDLIQICGLADGIRMFNILRAKPIAPRLTVYVSTDGSSYNAIYLLTNTASELSQKLFKLPGFYELIAKTSSGAMDNGGALYNNWSLYSKYSGSGSNIFNDGSKSSVYITGPSGVHVAITDEVLNNEVKDGSLYAIDFQSGKVVMKMIDKNDN